ncbi:SAM-dependent methyltransferase [Saccharopolyspora dendranthemae]|uniref:S-adenosyl methyltransferase n=1 Tax=Saccharopolyspora dendranthemae TaxID=1181886 RepID=A0A561V944_9PSEU|nr:SAM-dependent methyltransferase [Saccharopolyspora dendranthemae]TWG08146.1 S-adenosyl methyltransferase [Saccharopolyspora dendranthemae]
MGFEGGAAGVGPDTSKASIARVYDMFLGGKDNFAVDREVYEAIQAVSPHGDDVAKSIRRWLIRVVRHLAGFEVGIGQFLDIGSGLPTVDNTHEVAQRHNPDATVVYVDNDATVAAYGRALMEENDHTHFATSDLRDPAALLATPQVAKLDFSQPMVLIQCATLHHVDDDADPAAFMRRYADALPSGSYLAISHWWDPREELPEGHRMARELEQRWRESSMATGRYRTREEITELFGGLELVEPGLVELNDWWPDGPGMREPSLVERLILGGVAYKP